MPTASASSLTPYDLEHIAKTLGKASSSGQGYICLCPAHDDHNPSLSLSLGDNGKLLAHCFSGCSFEEILTGIRNRKLLPHQFNGSTKYNQKEKRPKPTVVKSNNYQKDYTPLIPVPKEAPPFTERMCDGYSKKFGCKPSAFYRYQTQEAEIAQYMVRWDGIVQDDGTTRKETRPYTYAQDKAGHQEWIPLGMPSPYPPYNLPEILKRANDPILVVEGEKTVEKIKDVFPDYIVTTTLFGAKSPQKTDWSFAHDRSIIICPDFDEAGQQYGDRVCTLCKEAGAKSVQYLPVQDVAKNFLGIAELEKGYDLADAVEDSLKDVLHHTSLETLIVPYLTQLDIESQSLPKNFRFDDKRNIEYRTIEKNKITKEWEEVWKFLCSYMVVTHYMRDGKSNEWARILKILDKDGVQKEFRMPMSLLAGDGNILKEKLLSMGVLINFAATHTLKNYIALSNPKARARAFDKTGWDDHCYILSENKIYRHEDQNSKRQERLILNIEGYSSVFEQKGTLEDWQQTLGLYANGNSRLQFAILAALAAPLLKFVDEENFGIHYFGSSSIGKSITLQIASSIWGKKVHTWRTTDNAAESLARGSNDSLLILDELSQVNADAADAMAYMLGNGAGKARANKKGEAKRISNFTLIFLSSGEVLLQSKISESKNHKKIKGGQTVRFIEIPADAEKGFGVFENLHGFESPGKFADTLKELSTQYQGTLIDAWLSFLTNNREITIREIKDLRKQWLHTYPIANADGQVERVRSKLALLAAVGEYAIKQGFLPWELNSCFYVCEKIFKSWLLQRGGTDSHEALEVENRLIRFMEAHGSSRFEHVQSKIEKDFWKEINNPHNQGVYETKQTIEPLKTHTIYNRVGFRLWGDISEEAKQSLSQDPTSNPEGIVWHYYFLQESFEQEILQGLNKKIILPILAQKGLIFSFIEKTKDAKDKVRYTQNIRIPGYGQQRLYQIGDKIYKEDFE